MHVQYQETISLFCAVILGKSYDAGLKTSKSILEDTIGKAVELFRIDKKVVLSIKQQKSVRIMFQCQIAIMKTTLKRTIIHEWVIGGSPTKSLASGLSAVLLFLAHKSEERKIVQ